MIDIQNVDQARAAAKRMQRSLDAGMGRVKLATVQGILARTLGYRSWEDLADRFDAASLPSDEDVEARLRAEIEENARPHDGRSLARAIDAIIGAIDTDTTATQALASAPPSPGFRSMAEGIHPLIGRRTEGRFGRILLAETHAALDVQCFIHAHHSETATLRVVDLSYEARDGDGLVACMWGTAFIPMRALEDHEAIEGADEASDDDVRVITSLVCAHPGFFRDAGGILLLDGIETRRDARRRGIASALLTSALSDLVRRWGGLSTLVHSPERSAGDQPSHRVPGDVRLEVEAIVADMIERVAVDMDVDAITIRMTPERGRLQTLMDVSMAMRGGEPGMGTDLSEEDLERRLHGRTIAQMPGGEEE